MRECAGGNLVVITFDPMPDLLEDALALEASARALLRRSELSRPLRPTTGARPAMRRRGRLGDPFAPLPIL